VSPAGKGDLVTERKSDVEIIEGVESGLIGGVGERGFVRGLKFESRRLRFCVHVEIRKCEW
jgi:hypothetical protein